MPERAINHIYNIITENNVVSHFLLLVIVGGGTVVWNMHTKITILETKVELILTVDPSNHLSSKSVEYVVLENKDESVTDEPVNEKESKRFEEETAHLEEKLERLEEELEIIKIQGNIRDALWGDDW